MKQPALKGERFLADVRRVIDSRGRALWWLGQSGFLIVQDGRGFLLDPYLSDSLTRKYASTDKPHVRITEQVIEPEELATLDVIQVVTSSHGHTDHFDAETLLPLLKGSPRVVLVLPRANRDMAVERLGAEFASKFVELDAGESVQVAGMQIHGIASAHPTVERDAAGHCRFLGYVIGWSGLSLYHSGDTLWHEGLVPALHNFAIDVALLPINGDRPERRVAGNLDGAQAARLAHEIGAQWAIPCHFDLFEFNTEPPDGFVAECQRLEQPYVLMRNGERWDLPVGG